MDLEVLEGLTGAWVEAYIPIKDHETAVSYE
jgi:hypothetical protein